MSVTVSTYNLHTYLVIIFSVNVVIWCVIESNNLPIKTIKNRQQFNKKYVTYSADMIWFDCFLSSLDRLPVSWKPDDKFSIESISNIHTHCRHRILITIQFFFHGKQRNKSWTSLLLFIHPSSRRPIQYDCWQWVNGYFDFRRKITVLITIRID